MSKKTLVCTNTSCKLSKLKGGCDNQITSIKFKDLSEEELNNEKKYNKVDFKPEFIGSVKVGKFLFCPCYINLENRDHKGG